LRNSILFALVLAVVSVTSLNHYTTQAHLRYFEDVQLRDTHELARMKATEDAQIMATEALVVARFQTERLGYAEDYILELTAIAHQQREYMGVLIETLDAHGILPPAPGATDPEEKTEENPLVASSKTDRRL
jgi:hypothetical protein